MSDKYPRWWVCFDSTDLPTSSPKDPAPGPERAPRPGRGPPPHPPHPSRARSAVAPGPHLEGESGGALDPVRPKGLGFCGIPQWHWLLLAICWVTFGNSNVCILPHGIACCTIWPVFIHDVLLFEPADLVVLPSMFVWFQAPKPLVRIVPLWLQFKKELSFFQPLNRKGVIVEVHVEQNQPQLYRTVQLFVGKSTKFYFPPKHTKNSPFHHLF